MESSKLQILALQEHIIQTKI